MSYISYLRYRVRRRIRRAIRLIIILYLLLPALLGGTAPPRTSSLPESAHAVQPADTLSDWEVLQMAIAFTESRFKADAVGKSGDSGIYQIMPIYVREVNRLSGDERYTHEDAFDIGKSIEMFNTLQGFKNPEHDIELAIRHHNKSAAYRRTVLENCEMVRRYETLRSALKDYRNENRQ